MLSKRIAGMLKQYPNPEVAFFATEVLLDTSPYLTSGLRRRKRDDSVELMTGRPDDRYLHFFVNDPVEKLKQTKWHVYEDGSSNVCLSGRDLLHRDVFASLASLNDWRGRSVAEFFKEPSASEKQMLGKVIQGYLDADEWYDGRRLNQNYRTEIMAVWVGAWVNRWLKAFSKITTLGELIDHYESIAKLARGLGDVCDYVAEERVDPAHLTFNQLLHRSRRWHAAQRRDMMAAAAPPSERVYDRGNYGIFKLTTREALEHEGNFMHHCVERYWNKVHDGVCEIYSVRNLDGKSVATIEVRPPGAGQVIQIKGPANRPVKKPAELCDTIYYFLESIGATNRTGSCMEPSEARENPDDEYDDDEYADEYADDDEYAD